jgi:subtilisin family serine protease
MAQVEYVEKDSVVHALGNDAGELEKNAPWGLARISHRDSLTFSDFNKYLYAADAGEGVDIYIIDTGTSPGHVDFEGRAHWGKTIPADDTDEDGGSNLIVVSRDNMLTEVSCRKRTRNSLLRNCCWQEVRCRQEGQSLRSQGAQIQRFGING